MSKKQKLDAIFSGYKLQGHRAAEVFTLEGVVYLKFIGPIKPEDFANGKPKPRANAYRKKGKLVTVVPLLPDTAEAIRRMLNKLPKPECVNKKNEVST